MNLLPYPRFLKRGSGFIRLPRSMPLQVDDSLSSDVVRLIVQRLQSAAKNVLFTVSRCRIDRLDRSGTVGIRLQSQAMPGIDGKQQPNKRSRHPISELVRKEQYTLVIDRRGVQIQFEEIAGLRAAVATLRQLFREYGTRLPCLSIHDWPDFPRRGVMLDVSRGRVPNLNTLRALADHLADFKINELQLYTEHTFAYRRYRSVWSGWGALSGAEIRKLDAHCRRLGIDLVPNQNSFGHLRYFLEHPRLKKLAEVSEPYEDGDGAFLRHPSTLAPTHRETLPFLRALYRELLPHFSSKYFNVGCDETWDLGRGQSRELCNRIGKANVYLRFLRKIHREVAAYKRRMMFWGDIILRHPELISRLPKNAIALNWGYQASHPFNRESRLFARAGLAFYVCPGTSTWMTLIGKHDNALANLRSAARAGLKHRAIGYLITDWGDGGHPQPLAVSYLPYLAGAAMSWCEKTFDQKLLVPVLSRDIFEDPTKNVAEAAYRLGMTHRLFRHNEANSTPFGTVIAAPPPEQRELFCLNGLKLHSRIERNRILAALGEVVRHQKKIVRSRPTTNLTKTLALELGLASRMAVESCHFMLFQQAVSAGNKALARRLARQGIRRLGVLEKDFANYWSSRNKGTTKKCSAFLDWRKSDYLKLFLNAS